MFGTKLGGTARNMLATTTIALLALGAPMAASAGGLRNCVDITGRQLGQVGCYEQVWSGGVEYRMTFSNQSYGGAKPGPLGRFYVLAPQGPAAQGPVPTFPHDHVISNVPGGGSNYSAKLAGFFVLCTEQGLVSGDCVPLFMAPPGGPVLPFADTVAGGPLTSTGAIEAAAAAGDVALIDLGPGAVIVGTVNPAN